MQGCVAVVVREIEAGHSGGEKSAQAEEVSWMESKI